MLILPRDVKTSFFSKIGGKMGKIDIENSMFINLKIIFFFNNFRENMMSILRFQIRIKNVNQTILQQFEVQTLNPTKKRRLTTKIKNIDFFKYFINFVILHHPPKVKHFSIFFLNIFLFRLIFNFCFIISQNLLYFFVLLFSRFLILARISQKFELLLRT